MLRFDRAITGLVSPLVAVSLIVYVVIVPVALASSKTRVVQNREAIRSSDAKNAPATRPASEYDRLRQEGNAALYNLDYHKARECFEKMADISPDNPAAYVYLANNLWLETLNKSRRLSTSLYSTTSFYVQNSESDETDRARDRQFEAWITKAIEVATAKLAQNPSDAESLYYQASALGLRASYKATVGRSFRRAIGDANKSIQLQRKVLALDPEYIDAYLSVGLYEYVIDSLPFLWRTLARLAGLKGSKQRGIQELEMVVKSGKYASDDARVLLIAIYSREHQPQKAMQQIDYLAARYPANYLFSVERARMLFDAGRAEEGADVFAALLRNESIAGAATDLIDYQWGEALMKSGDYAGAIDRYKAVLAWSSSQPDLVSLAHLHSGEALDAQGKRDAAEAEYREVIKRPNVFDSHDEAKGYLSVPYKAGKVDQQG